MEEKVVTDRMKCRVIERNLILLNRDCIDTILDYVQEYTETWFSVDLLFPLGCTDFRLEKFEEVYLYSGQLDIVNAVNDARFYTFTIDKIAMKIENHIPFLYDDVKDGNDDGRLFESWDINLYAHTNMRTTNFCSLAAGKLVLRMCGLSNMIFR